MTFDEAKEALGFHCGRDGRIDDRRWQNGFLSTLRPYKGLRRDVMSHVTKCINAVEEHLVTAPLLDRELISSLWAIVHYGRAWAIEPEGMLQSNSLITDDDTKELETWLVELSDRISNLLDTGKPGA